eukprot:GEMP01008133.1.p1 GENE.GEMP01008133.1~~GEMP01008133.1.p1  ORF type:complete len:663 (+),score=154.55 GEMP01008133.1:11-1999(+)
MPQVNHDWVRNAQLPNGFLEATERMRQAREKRSDVKNSLPKRCPIARQPFSFGDGVQKSKPVEKQPLAKLIVNMPGLLRSSSTRSIRISIHEDSNVAKMSVNFEKIFGLSKETTVDLFCCLRDLQDESLKLQREDYARKKGLFSDTTAAPSQVSLETEWYDPSTFVGEEKDDMMDIKDIKNLSKEKDQMDDEDMDGVNLMNNFEEELISMEHRHPTPQDDVSAQEVISLTPKEKNYEHVSTLDARLTEAKSLREAKSPPTPRSGAVLTRQASSIGASSPHASMVSPTSSLNDKRLFSRGNTPRRMNSGSSNLELFRPHSPKTSPKTLLPEVGYGDNEKESSVEEVEEKELWDDQDSLIANADGSDRSAEENISPPLVEIEPPPKMMNYTPSPLDDPDVDMLQAYFSSFPKEKRPDVLLEGHGEKYRDVAHDPRVVLTAYQQATAMLRGVDDNIIDRQKFARWVSHRDRTGILDEVYAQWMVRWSEEYRSQKQVPPDERGTGPYSFSLSPLRRMRKFRHSFTKRTSKGESPTSARSAEPTKQYLRDCGWMLLGLMRAGFSQPLLLMTLESEQISRVVDSLVNGLLQDEVLSATFAPATNAENVRDAVTRVIWLCLMLSTEQRKDFKGRRIWNHDSFLKCGQQDCRMKRDMLLVLYKNIAKCPF